MTTPVTLPALDGRDPLGFLAALGVLHTITSLYGTSTRLAFSNETGAAVLHSRLADTDAVAAALGEAVAHIGEGCVIDGVGPGFPLRKPNRRQARETGTSQQDPMRVRRSDYRNRLHDKVADLAAPAALDWLSVLVTDLAVDLEGRAALTPYNAPSGQQSLWTFFEKPLAAVRSEPARLREALTGWRRIDKFTGEYLDHRVLRSAAEHPSGKSTEAGVPGATWLAIQALPLLRLTGDGRNAKSTLWYRIGQRTMMIWPLWHPPLDEHAACVLIEHPLLRPNAAGNGQRAEPRVSRRKLAPLGVFEVCGAERLTIDGRKSAGVLAPIVIPEA